LSTARSAPSATPVGRLPARRTPGSPVEALVIGVSTGGPNALAAMLPTLPADLPVPVLIVQHMSPGFIRGFAEWLALSSGLPVHVASDGVKLLPGNVYVAPDGCHMLVDRNKGIRLSDAPPENGLRPAVSALFRSVTKIYGGRAVGVLLTGMGRDGADELLIMKKMGAVTIIQDQASSVIYGMPGEAAKLDAASFTLPPAGIGALLAAIEKQSQ